MNKFLTEEHVRKNLDFWRVGRAVHGASLENLSPFLEAQVRILHPPLSLDEALAKSSIVELRRTKSARTMWYVCMLTCNDEKTYVGCTDNLDERLKRHDSGWVPATKRRLPVKLTTYLVFTDKYKAYGFEKYLKSGSGRAFLKKRFI